VTVAADVGRHRQTISTLMIEMHSNDCSYSAPEATATCFTVTQRTRNNDISHITHYTAPTQIAETMSWCMQEHQFVVNVAKNRNSVFLVFDTM